MNLSETLKTLCKELGITCSELARRSGQSSQNLNKKINKNTLSFEEFERLIKLMDVQMECGFTMPGGNPSSKAMYDQHIKDQMDILETQLKVERMKNRYFTNISYELRTALNTISGGMEIMANHSDDSKKIEECVDKIRPAINEITKLISDNPFNRETGITLVETDYDTLETSVILNEKRSLLVDDNEINREIVKELLMDSGIIVEEAENGLDALNKVKTKDTGYYDFVLMDLYMPVLNGFEATKKIRALRDNRKSKIPVIAMTASVSAEDEKRAMDSGMDGFIEKPLDLNKLFGIVQKL